MKKFWNWVRNEDGTRILTIDGVIAEESWFEDDVTPKLFREQLNAGTGDIVIFINSPGGDCVAASQIYTMLIEYKGNVTVKIDGIAASAASVIAMAGTEVLMAPTSLLMLHNPLTVAIGDSEEMQKAIAMLDEVKESIIESAGLPMETGVFSGTAPDEYVVITPISEHFALFSDDAPGMNIEEARLSLFSKKNYTQRKDLLVRMLLTAGFVVTDRRFIGREDDTGYFHVAIDVAKETEEY